LGKLYQQVGQYLQDATADAVILEIGSDRYEGSSYYFAELAARYQMKFVTIDLDPNALHRARKNMPDDILSSCEFVHNEALAWTATFAQRDQQIAALYLDNFDWDWSINQHSLMIAEQQTWYARQGIIMNNINCQTSHIGQMVNLLPYMMKKSVVCVDDTYEYNGVYIGKGGAVVPYLLSQGFDVLQARDYGVILGRGYKNINV
jgi:16S rRNA G966 N2-methylase RsmD